MLETGQWPPPCYKLDAQIGGQTSFFRMEGPKLMAGTRCAARGESLDAAVAVACSFAVFTIHCISP